MSAIAGARTMRRMRFSPLTALGLEPGGLPRLDAAGQVGVVGQSCLLRQERRGNRAVARAAVEYHTPALRIRQCARVETLERRVDRAGNTLSRDLAGLAHGDEQDLGGVEPGLHFLGVAVLDEFCARPIHGRSVCTMPM